ncbi:MAG: hypothetical protein GC145_07910 [Caulobacter sp.]|nr:hypothetical protein [Caulobacter sp.]
MPVREIEERRFNALAGYTRDPRLVAIVQEYAWFETDDGRVVGMLTWDRVDRDFGWIALGRDERGQLRAIDVNSSLTTTGEARSELVAAMERWQAGPDVDMHQGEDDGPPVDFFAPITPEADQHPIFRVLRTDPRYSPARELIAAMMRYHRDVDGNFIQQFQTVAFDARLWELYLFATFTELGFVQVGEGSAPDFILAGLRGGFGVEATTANPPQGGAALPELNADTLSDYIGNYVPIKLARPLKKKLRKPEPYWAAPGMEGLPFAIALQDFHAPGSMRMIVPAATEYVFGVRHSMEDGQRRIEWINKHSQGALEEASGFFRFPNAENVSAVIVNPQGTLVKFNRMGLLAGFGDPRVRMVRTGVRRHDGDLDPRPRPFTDQVHEPGYAETWVEGMVVLHNPAARIRLDRDLIRGATHEFLQPDGRIMSGLPDEPPPYFSQTYVMLDGDDLEQADVQSD